MTGLIATSSSNNTNVIADQPTYPTSWSAVALVVAGIALLALAIFPLTNMAPPIIYSVIPAAFFCFLFADIARSNLRGQIQFEFAQKCLQAGFRDKAESWLKTASHNKHPGASLELGKLQLANYNIFTSNDELEKIQFLSLQAKKHSIDVATKTEANKLYDSVSAIKQQRESWYCFTRWEQGEKHLSMLPGIAQSAAKQLQKIVEYYKPSQQPGANQAPEGFTKKYAIAALRLVNCASRTKMELLLFAAAKLNLPSVIKLIIIPFGTKAEDATHIDQVHVIDINSRDQTEDSISCSQNPYQTFENFVSEKELYFKTCKEKYTKEKPDEAEAKAWEECWNNYERRTSSNHTPLMCALWHNQVEAAKTLIKLKADLTVKDRLNFSVRQLLDADDRILTAYCSCFGTLDPDEQLTKAAQLKAALQAIKPLCI